MKRREEKYNSDSILVTRENLKLSMENLKSAFDNIYDNNNDLNKNEILKICGITGKDKEQMLTFIDCNFYLPAIEDKLIIDKTLFNKSYKKNLINKLKSFKRVDNKKFGILTKEISFYPSTIIQGDRSNKKRFKEGTKLEFLYNVPRANLYIFKFETDCSFPLSEDEFKWA